MNRSCGILVALLAALLGARAGAGAGYAAGQYVGPGTCASGNCHGNPEPARVYGVLQNEYYTWHEQDAHRGAAEALFGERAVLIARNLELAQPAHRSRICLDCHTLNAPRRLQAVALELADGVSCESCHGPAGGWLARHNEEGWTHADSLAAGMTDLGDARARARLCLGCHQGEPGREVGHELLAAGHPELYFELDNFTESLPPHWAGERASHGLAAWAAGQAEAFRQGVRLLSHRAASPRWPEFAELACDSCHHDLAGGRWRQVRGYRYRAGLPSWSPARWAALRHLVAAAAPAEAAAVDAEVARLAAEVAALTTPAARLQETSARAAAALDRALPLLAGAWSERRARDLALRLARDRDPFEAADRQSAEQTALALQSLVAHLAARRPRLERGPLPARVRALFAELDDPYRFDRERFAALLAALAAELP